MRASAKPRVVLVMVPTRSAGRKIARSVINKELAACVNILVSPVTSIYKWKGKIEQAREYLLLIKTTSSRYKALEREIAKLHSYDVPEIVALPITAGLQEYLAWLHASVASKVGGKFSSNAKRTAAPGRGRR